MSASKFESLPNEILIEILEKYINGIDIVNAFAFQLNRRFDALIGQCQRFRFDFMQCRKNDFSLCMGLLPAYIDRIEELSLSEYKTPGQIYAFLNFFPTFAPFKQLRRLYFHAKGDTCEWELVERALLSIHKTNIDTLALKMARVPNQHTVQYCIASILATKSLQNLFVSTDAQNLRWALPSRLSSNIEQLVLDDNSFRLFEFEAMLRAMPNLKYFKARVNPSLVYDFHQPNTGVTTVTKRSMPTPHTVILDIKRADSVSLQTLQECLQLIPGLRHLKITSSKPLFDANVWELLLTTSFTSLTHFKLNVSTLSITAEDALSLLNSFETPFWLKRSHFTIAIAKSERTNQEDRFPRAREYLDKHSDCQPIAQYWARPKRLDSSPGSPITAMIVTDASKLQWENHYFSCVHRLFINTEDNGTLSWIVTHIDGSQVYYLEVSSSSISVRSLLPVLKNVRCIHASFDQIRTNGESNFQAIPSVRYLNLADSLHSFNEEEIIMIATLFPNLEHLGIFTEQLFNVPLLQRALPRLRSLTHRIVDIDFPPVNADRLLSRWEAALRRRTKFLFHRHEHYLTIWLDDAVDDRSYWKTFGDDASLLPYEESFDPAYDDDLLFFN